MPDLRLFIPEVVALNAAVIILVSLAVYLDQRIQIGWSAGFILLIAAGLRIMFLWRAPELSDDLYRYIFDGLMFLDGRNPYAASPADILTDDPAISLLISRINHAGLVTIYPPAAQLVFAVGAFIGGGTGMKLCLVILDLISCIIIFKILDIIALPRVNALLYAWHPLPVIEIAASGHVDAAAIFFTLLAFLFLLAEKSSGPSAAFHSSETARYNSLTAWPWLAGGAAGTAFSMAVSTKWIPLIFTPGVLLLAKPGNRKYVVFGFLMSATALYIFFQPDVWNSFRTLFTYAADWEFSGFLFRRLRNVIGSGKTARMVIVVAFGIASAIIYGGCYKRKHPSSLLRIKDIFNCFYLIATAFLVLTPTLHPWYVLYLAAFLPFAAGPAGIVFSWSIFLAYRVVILYGLTGQWIENDMIPFLIAVAPAVAFTASISVKNMIRRSDISVELMSIDNLR